MCACVYHVHTIQPETLAVIKFGGFAPNNVFNTIDGLKFGSMVRYRHTNMHTEKKLVDFNLAVERHTAKPPNLIPCQNFQLYSIAREVQESSEGSPFPNLREAISVPAQAGLYYTYAKGRVTTCRYLTLRTRDGRLKSCSGTLPTHLSTYTRALYVFSDFYMITIMFYCLMQRCSIPCSAQRGCPGDKVHPQAMFTCNGSTKF